MVKYNRLFFERSPRFPHPLYGEGFKKLSISNLSFSLNEHCIFNNVNIDLLRHDLSLIIGENGIGKSTLFKIITKQLPGYSGEVILDGRNTSEYSSRELATKIAYLPQKIIFDTPYTVLEMLAMSGYSNQKETEGLIQEALNLFQIEEIMHKKITQLSGGEMQRALLASTYVVGGHLMLLDEPFSFLDPGQRRRFFELIVRLHEQQKRTFFLVVNSLEEIMMFKDVERLKIYVIKDTQIASFDEIDKNFSKLFYDIFGVKVGK